MVLVGADRSFSIARLASDLTPLGIEVIEDPAIADDPHAAEFGDTELLSNGFAPDSARVGALGETTVAAVFSSMYSVVAYRLNFAAGSWSAPARTLRHNEIRSVLADAQRLWFAGHEDGPIRG